MFDLFREVNQTLKNNRVRTFLTGIAVAWGIFMLIVLLGMARGVVNNFESTNWAQTSNSINIYGGSTSQAYNGYSEGRVIKPETNDMKVLTDKHPDLVSQISSYNYLGNIVFSTSRDYKLINSQGVYPIEQKRDGIKIIQGRFINNADILNNRKSVVMEEKVAKTLFGTSENVVGKRIDGLGLSWLIVGIYSHEWRDDIYIPFSTAKLLTGNDKNVDNLMVEIKNVKTMEEGEEAENQLRKTLAIQHGFSPEDKSGLYFSNRFTDYLRNKSVFNILNLSVWIIGIFTLLSGIVGVSNIMFVSVRERTHEIGIRRAIGAKPRNVLFQIITESVAITTLFGYIGVFFGMIVTQAIAAITNGSNFLKNPTVSLEIAIEVTITMIIAGTLAGLFPAIKATKVKPVEALRDE